jgi:hypothetical protein
MKSKGRVDKTFTTKLTDDYDVSKSISSLPNTCKYNLNIF